MPLLCDREEFIDRLINKKAVGHQQTHHVPIIERPCQTIRVIFRSATFNDDPAATRRGGPANEPDADRDAAGGFGDCQEAAQ